MLLPEDWQRVFRIIAVVGVVAVLLVVILLTRKTRYFGPLFERLYARTDWEWTEGRVARFILDVERIFLSLRARSANGCSG